MDALMFVASAVVGTSVVVVRPKHHPLIIVVKKLLLSSSLHEQLQKGLSLNAKERVCTVSPDNVPLDGGHDRNQMRLEKLWHRATYCLIRHEPPHLPTHTRPPDGDIYVLLQKRSSLKDYYPGTWDPTPGGVVGYGESYEENIQRELQEEMGMVVVMTETETKTKTKTKSYSNTTLKKLFTFPYQDEATVRVYGGFFECIYRGTLNELQLQTEEVEEVRRIHLRDLQDWMTQSPQDFMPDSIYALQLYLQHQQDMKVSRRFLKGSSSDLEQFRIRPKIQAIFFDCDDCLYFDDWTTANRLTKKIDEWCTEQHGLPTGRAYELYKQYGTALRGLLAEGYLEDTPEAIDRFLETVHDIGIEKGDLIQPDPRLQQILAKLDPSIPRYIFTASVAAHARRCLQALGIEEYFPAIIIDCKQCDLETKHSLHSFHKAMEIAGVQDPQACLFLDDSITNIEAARRVGWRAILVGTVARDTGSTHSSEDAELELESIHDIETVLPEIFVQ